MGTPDAGAVVEARRRGIILSSCAVCVALTAALTMGEAFALERGTGWLALLLLIATLAITPVTVLLGRAISLRGAGARSWVPPLSRARRSLGLGAALAAAVHVPLALAGYFGRSVAWGAALDAIFALPWLRHGLVAFSILAVLAVTSMKPIARRLRHWPALHRTIYLAAIAASLHALLGPHGTSVGAIALGVVVLLLLLRTLPHRRPSVRERDVAPHP